MAVNKKRKVGGQPGNLNRVARQPWTTFWRRRALRERDRWIEPMLRRYRADLLNDKPDATAGEKAIIELAALARGCILLILSRAAEEDEGICAQLNKRAIVSSELSRFTGLEMTALTKLGLERRAKVLPSSHDVVARIVAARKPSEGTAQ